MATDPRLTKILDAMKRSAEPLSTPTAINENTPTRITPRPIPSLDPTDIHGPANDLPSRDFTPEQSPQGQTPAPRLGVSLKGLTGVDKSLADLAVKRQAATEFPSSDVKNGEILPPKMHHGIRDRLKSLGRTAVIGMGEVARQHPNASTAELLGAGAAGAGIGGLSPVTGDEMLRRAQIRQQEGDVSRELDIAKDEAGVDYARAKPGLDAAKIENDARMAEARNQIERNREQGRVSRAEADRQQRELDRASREKTETERNKIRREQGSKPDRTEIRGEQERERKRSAAENELKSLGEEEEGARIEKQRKQDALTELQKKPPSEVPADVLAAGEREAREADGYYKGFADKKREAKRRLNENASSRSAAPDLNIDGAIEHFQKVKKRKPTETEIANMRKAIGQ